jgi:hypothetical protein
MNTKFLLTDQELAALMQTSHKDLVEKSIKDDPTWGLDGSGELNVVYCNYEVPATLLVTIGMDIQIQYTKL